MSTTQRSDSINSYFDKYVNKQTSLELFVEQYDRALKKRVEDEKEAEFKSMHKPIPVVTIYPFEKQFQEAYTNEIFRLFQDEIRGMIFCNVDREGFDNEYKTFDVTDVACGKDGFPRRVVYKVMLLEDKFDIKCMCRLFVFKGIVCRHMVKVFIAKGIQKVPSEYIMDRWRKGIKREYNFVPNTYDEVKADEQQGRHEMLYAKFAPICDIAVTSEYNFEFAGKVLDFMLTELTLNEECADHENNNIDDGSVKVLSPLRKKTKGRPSMKRLEKAIFSGKRKKKGIRCSGAHDAMNLDGGPSADPY